MIRFVCGPPEKMLQCRCPPEHLRSSAFATFMEFLSSILWACEPVLVPPHRSTTARRDIGRPPPAQHQACPGSHVSSTSPSFLLARGVHAERISHHRSVSWYISHTKVKCCMPSRASALHRSESFAKFCNCENAAHRGDPTSRSGISFV